MVATNVLNVVVGVEHFEEDEAASYLVLHLLLVDQFMPHHRSYGSYLGIANDCGNSHC